MSGSLTSKTNSNNIFNSSILINHTFIEKLHGVFVVLKTDLPHLRILCMLPLGAAQVRVVWRTWPAAPSQG